MLTKYQEAYRQLNAAQKLAVDTIEGPVLVVAGPGTGKTQLLSMRIANILQKTDSLPQNILCLTFTESAAQTMRERLGGIIGQAAYDITISTYHAFGSELLRRYPEYFNTIIDAQPADDLAIDAAFRKVQTTLSYSNPLKSDFFLGDVKQFVSECKRALLEPTDLRLIADENLAFITHASNVTRLASDDLRRVSKRSILAFTSLLDITMDTTRLHELPSHLQSLTSLWNSSLQSALNEVAETTKTTALSKWKLQWLTKDQHDQFVVAGADVQHRIQAAADIYERYLEELAAQSLYDYDDMILRSIAGLRKHPELRYTLQERYLYVLLDEFQDTNQAQYQLVDLLTDNPINEGRPNILAVGDDDQAIYAFQGANYSHMLRFYKEHADVKVIPLVENYRSHATILQLAEYVSDQIETRLHHNFPTITKNLVARVKPISSHTAPVRQITCVSELEQAIWISREVKRLIAEGLPGNEIALIAVKHSQLENVLPFLKQADIAVHYDRRENILDDPAIDKLVIMSQLVIDLHTNHTDQVNADWPAVLAMEIWHLAPEVIWNISWQAREQKHDWSNILLKEPATHSLALFFIQLAQQVAAQTLEQILDQLIGTREVDLGEIDQHAYHSPYYSHYFGSAGSSNSESPASYWQLLSNLTVLREHLREHGQTTSTSLKLEDLLGFITAHRDAGIKVLNTSPYRDDTTAIELLTAHRAKGREFQAVFLLSVVNEVWGSSARSGSSRLSLPPNLQFIRHAGADEDERLRLFFVALTRAKHQLYLMSYTTTYSGRQTSELKYLAMDDKQGTHSLNVSTLLSIESAPSEPPTLSQLTTNWRSKQLAAASQPKLRSLLQDRLQQYQLSPTDYNRYLDIIHGGPADFFMKVMLRFPSAPTTSLQFGNAMHQTLEWIHYYNKSHSTLPTLKQTEDIFKQRLEAQQPASNTMDLLLERGATSLQSYLAQRGATVQANAYSEYSFRDENIFIGEAHLGGKIDKLLINDTDKTITIVDYKTGKALRRQEHTPRMHFYENQLYFYKLLVENSSRFAGYEVVDAYLEFVEPDQEGQIRELHVRFDAAKMDRLCELIEIVWQHIMDLDFPDTAAYPLTIGGIEQFETALIKAVEL